MPKKLKKPEYNVKYTIRYWRKDGSSYLLTFIFDGIEENGRFRFFEINKKYRTSMLLSRFSFLYNNNLEKEERVTGEQVQIRENYKLKREERAEERETKNQYIKYLEQIDNFTKYQKELSAQAIGRPFDYFREDFKEYTYATSPEEAQEINRRTGVMTDWLCIWGKLKLSV